MPESPLVPGGPTPSLPSPVRSDAPPTRRELRARERAGRAQVAFEPPLAAPVTSRRSEAAPAPTPALTPAPAPSTEASLTPAPALSTEAATIPEAAPRFRRRAELRREVAAEMLPAAPAAAPVPTGPRPPVAASTPRRARQLVARLATGAVAMGFAALMVVSVSVPANSLLSRADVDALNEQYGSDARGDQTINVASGASAEQLHNEAYTSMTLDEYAEAAGIIPEATFTNDPYGTIQWPFKVGVHIGDRFGYRNCAGCSADHQGQDFNPGFGAEIQAIADGVVVYTEDGEASLGVHMIIEHQIDGQTVASVYAHMQHGSMRFAEGDRVKVGDVIGLTGNTGQSTGPHLHFEIRLGGMNGTHVDPLEWLYANTN